MSAKYQPDILFLLKEIALVDNKYIKFSKSKSLYYYVVQLENTIFLCDAKNKFFNFAINIDLGVIKNCMNYGNSMV